MSGLPVAKARKARKALEKIGCQHAHTTGSHAIYEHPQANFNITLPINHPGDDVSKIVMGGIRNQLGKDLWKQFLKHL